MIWMAIEVALRRPVRGSISSQWSIGEGGLDGRVDFFLVFSCWGGGGGQGKGGRARLTGCWGV